MHSSCIWASVAWQTKEQAVNIRLFYNKEKASRQRAKIALDKILKDKSAVLLVFLNSIFSTILVSACLIRGTKFFSEVIVQISF